MLHIVNRPAALSSCLLAAEQSDALLLLGDGVYAAADSRLAKMPAVAAIDEDAMARGVRVAPPIAATSYAGFVALVAQHDVSVTWT